MSRAEDFVEQARQIAATNIELDELLSDRFGAFYDPTPPELFEALQLAVEQISSPPLKLLNLYTDLKQELGR